MKKITLLGVLFFALTLTANAQQDLTSLLDRFETVKNQPGNIHDYFTPAELTVLNTHLRAANPSTSIQTRSGGVTGYGWESQGFGYGSFTTTDPTFTGIATGSGTADFESSGAIDPSDNSVAYVMDNVGEMWSVDVATGAYTGIGNVGVVDATGMHFDVSDGTLYMITLTDLYTVDPSGPTATFVGALNTGGGAAIALAIDGDGNGYTYDITDDTFYSIDLSSGAATAIGGIGFDAGFGQGMFWDQSSDTVFMAALNAGGGNLGELRAVNLADGTSTVVGEFEAGSVRQVAWASVGNTGTAGVEDSALAQVSFYPNPSSDVVKVRVPASIEITGSALYDVLGKRTNVQINNGVLDISSLARGVYLLNVETNAGTITEKIIKR